MQILRLTPEHPLWSALAEYADLCSWEAGPHLARLLRDKQLTGWETVFAAVAATPAGQDASAEDAGTPARRIVGFCTFLKTDYYPENRYSPWISSIFVDEAVRGLRICGQLIATACDYASAQGFTRVYIPSDMTGFYERYGFRPIDTLINYSGDTDNIFAFDLPPAGEVTLRRAAMQDAETLHRMKHDAFWPLYEKYHDDATSPALEMLGKLRSQLDHPASDWYLILRDGEPVGGMRIVRERTAEGLPCCRISPLFVLGRHQGQGVATRALMQAFARYPEAAQWRLSTILQEYGNCRLYEKLCFRRTETEPSAYPDMDFVHYTRLREDTPMRRLALLTDRELLGQEGLSHAAPRLTARAILRNPQGLYAVTHTEGFGIHMLPGGGVESGESVLTALHREVFEETGCRVTSATPLGYVEENRGHADYTQLSCYFVCETCDTVLQPHLTEAEAAHGATAAWMTLEQLWDAISSPTFERPQGRFLQARDMAALRAYMQQTAAPVS